MQPVWIEVRNGTAQPLWFLRSGTDPDYYSPREVAWSLHAPLGGGLNAQVDDFFDNLAFKNPIAPGTVIVGILFTNPERGNKVVNVDLLGRRTLIPFSLFLPVPDDAADSGSALFRYPDAQVMDYADLGKLREALEGLPCCATDVRGATRGDPLNVVFIGELTDIRGAVARRNYRRDERADDMAQQVFGRPPTPCCASRHKRACRSTGYEHGSHRIRFYGSSIYLVQSGRPVGGRFGRRGGNDIVLDDDVDDARKPNDSGYDVFGQSGEARLRNCCWRDIRGTALRCRSRRALLYRRPARSPVLRKAAS